MPGWKVVRRMAAIMHILFIVVAVVRLLIPSKDYVVAGERGIWMARKYVTYTPSRITNEISSCIM